MAGLRFIATGIRTTVAASATRTLLQLIAPTNQKIRIEKIVVRGYGLAAADPPAEIQIALQTTAGTSVAVTLKKVKTSDPETLQSSALSTFSGAEPTTTTVKDADGMHPQSRNTFIWPPDRPLFLEGNEKIGVIVVNGPTGASIDYLASAVCEE
jgi:hypothetical protein